MLRLKENLKLAVLKVKKWELKVKVVTKLCPKKQVSLGSSGHVARGVDEKSGCFLDFQTLFPISSPNTFCAVQTQSVQHFLFMSTVCVFLS